MGRGNTLTGGLGEDAFRFANPGDGRAVSDGNVFLGPMDAINDCRPGEPIELRTFGGPGQVPPCTRVEDVALIPDPIPQPGARSPEPGAAGRFRPAVGDGQYALIRGDFAGGGLFNVASGGGDDIAQGSLVLIGVTDPGPALIG
jgi:hypothetical protein